MKMYTVYGKRWRDEKTQERKGAGGDGVIGRRRGREGEMEVEGGEWAALTRHV